MKIGILDYGMGNLKSISNSLKHNEIINNIVTNYKDIKNNDILILPGVGAFETAMKNLSNKNFINEIKEHVDKNKKIIGICLGMQLLFERSFEFGEHKGLSLIEGDVLPFKEETNLRVPHVGWNNCLPMDKNYSQFEGDYYFVHSFYCKPKNNQEIILRSSYDIDFCSGVKKGNIFGFQFHPEKSHNLGLSLLKKIVYE
jgi:glutamine amidotransferase